MYYLKDTKEMGRGLYAAYTGIKQGTLITQCELLVLDALDTQLVNTTALQWYTFKFDDKRDCLVLGDGEIFNHSDNPNVGYKLQDYEGRKVMIFFALRNIEHNEQLFIDYGADLKGANITGYISNASLTGGHICKN